MTELESELKNLFLLAIRGDAVAYEAVLQRLSVLLRGYLMKTMNAKLRSVSQVEDLVQEVLIAIHRKRDLYDPERPFLAWVYAIARYRLIDSLRAEQRSPECVEWVEAFDSIAFVELPALFLDQQGEEILEGLTMKQKEILMMAKVEEIELAEIAKKFGMSLSAVKVTIHRSLKQIRKQLEAKAQK